VHYKTKWISCAAFLRRRNTRNKKLYLVYRRFNWRQRRFIRYKNSQLGCLACSTNCCESTLSNKFWFCCSFIQLPNLSRMKFAHIWRPSKGSRISWSSLKVYHMKPFMLRQNLDRKITGATIGYNVAVANSNLRYNLGLPWRKKNVFSPNSLRKRILPPLPTLSNQIHEQNPLQTINTAANFWKVKFRHFIPDDMRFYLPSYIRETPVIITSRVVVMW